jgi:hypothetical protein
LRSTAGVFSPAPLFRLRECLPSQARFERRDQVSRRRSGLDLDALILLTGDLLLDRLPQALPVFVLVVLGMKLSRGELADQPLGERSLLVADLRLGAPVDLGLVVDLTREVELLKEEPVLMHPDRHVEAYRRQVGQVRPLPGARELCQ